MEVPMAAEPAEPAEEGNVMKEMVFILFNKPTGEKM